MTYDNRMSGDVYYLDYLIGDLFNMRMCTNANTNTKTASPPEC